MNLGQRDKPPQQCLGRLFSQEFQKGSGYVYTIAEGEYRPTFVSTPAFFQTMANDVGFTVAEIVNNLYPQQVPTHFTEWYNYVLIKP
jgi:hypothetical protein